MVKKLNKDVFTRAGSYIQENGRLLEKYLFEDYFVKPCPEKIIRELERYQNEDGGFGNGLESDFLLPDSSPVATSIGLRKLVNLEQEEKARAMIKKAVRYLEKTFLPERKGWCAVSEKVNDYPHTPWWHFDPEEGMTVIDKHWGNPSAELIGYLARYKEFVVRLDVDQLLNNAFNYLKGKKEFLSFHEVYCFVRMAQLLPGGFPEGLRPKLYQAVQETVSLDPEEWEEGYVARPLDFVGKSILAEGVSAANDFMGANYGLKEEIFVKNLDYLVNKFENQGVLYPNWDKKFYQDGLAESWEKWIGVITLEGLITLEQFGRSKIRSL